MITSLNATPVVWVTDSSASGRLHRQTAMIAASKAAEYSHQLV